MPYQVIHSGGNTLTEVHNKINWCYSQFGQGDWLYRAVVGTVADEPQYKHRIDFYFSCEKDLMLFQLTWCYNE